MEYDLLCVYDFLTQTPEKGLRQMLVDSKSFTEAHFNLMLKTVRACKAEEFEKFATDKTFPKVKFGPAEQKIKEKFWDALIPALKNRGLLQPAQPKKQAA